MFLKEWKVLVFETDIQTHVTEYGLFRTVICISTSLLCQFEINHIGVSEILNINSLVLFPNFTFKSPIVPLSSRTKQIPNLLASFSNPVLPLVEVLICNTRPGKCRGCVCVFQSHRHQGEHWLPPLDCTCCTAECQRVKTRSQIVLLCINP